MFERTYSMKNTRNHKRLRAGYLMKFQPLNEEKESCFTNIKDMSASGLKFWTDQPLREGGMLAVSVCIPPIGRNFEAMAQVLRVRRVQDGIYYVAVRFVKVSEMDQTALNQFIDRLSGISASKRLVDNSFIVKRRVPVEVA